MRTRFFAEGYDCTGKHSYNPYQKVAAAGAQLGDAVSAKFVSIASCMSESLIHK